MIILKIQLRPTFHFELRMSANKSARPQELLGTLINDLISYGLLK